MNHSKTSPKHTIYSKNINQVQAPICMYIMKRQQAHTSPDIELEEDSLPDCHYHNYVADHKPEWKIRKKHICILIKQQTFNQYEVYLWGYIWSTAAGVQSNFYVCLFFDLFLL